MHLEIVHPFGFCSGVKRAIGIVNDTLKKKGICYSLGPIIHNSYVVEELSKRGLKLIKDLNSLPSSSLLLLPTHGTPLRIIKGLKRKNIDFIDLICPYVSSVHRICQNLKKRGFRIVIFGDKDHAEIKALKEIVSDAIVIDRESDLLDNSFLQKAKKIAVIAQTTQSKDKYLQIVNNLIKKYFGVKEFCIFNTICPDSFRRQEKVKELSKKVDLMIIIGGKESANTRRLFQIAKRIRKKSYRIEDQKDLDRLPILSMSRRRLRNLSIGISSGASTPEVLVREIIGRLKAWKKKI